MGNSSMKPIAKCRACGYKHLYSFLDLGKQYLSDFRTDKSKPPQYPLEAVICMDCYLVQLRHTVPQEKMYHENYGFKSGVSDSIKADLKEVVADALWWMPRPRQWLDIASNDGTLLSFVPKKVFRIGIDPIKFLCEEAEPHANAIINDYFSRKVLHDRFDSHILCDVITSISCFYDMPDPSGFVESVKYLLATDGVWVIQQNYLLSTLELGAVDNFCHEHLEYYTLLSLENLLERFDLEVIDVSTSTVNGGSIRTVVAHKGVYEPMESVRYLRITEMNAGIHTLVPYLNFSDLATKNLNELKDLVDALQAQGKSIYILAASTRGGTIWQAADIKVKKAVERNPAKVGKYFSALGIPIISEEQAREEKPDYMIVGPWFFKNELVKREHKYLKAGGHLIFPLPKLEVI